MSLALQLYTLRDHLDSDLNDTLKRVADIGYTQVEPYRIVSDTLELGAALREHGLSAPTAHAPLLSVEQEEIFAAATQLGIGTLILPATPQEMWTTAADVIEIATELNNAARAAAEHGLRVGYHNHWWEFAPIDERTAMEHFADLLHPDVVLEVDTYWAAVAGVDPVQVITTLGERVQYLHLKDGPITREPADQVALGQGRMPVSQILQAATHLRLGVVELDDHRGDMFTAVEQSLAYLSAGDR